MRGQYVNILTARFYQSYIGGDVISGIIITLIASLVLSKILCTTAIARIFLRTDRRMIGRRLLHGPWFFLGLGKGKRWPSFISFGYSPVSAALLRISAISVNTISGASLINSAG